jgi:hypothetical protein
MLFSTFAQRFTAALLPESILPLARSTGFLIRKGKIDPFAFVLSMVFGQLSVLRQTLASLAQSLPVQVSRQAIDCRYNSKTLAFMRAVFFHCLDQTFDWTPAQPQAQALKQHFSALYLLDSTCFDSPETLKEIFPSCGGDGSAANVKVLLRYELIAGRLELLKVMEGKRSDQGQAWAAAQRLEKNQLQINDKGFFDAKAWQAAQKAGAYLLMPLPHSVTLWTVKPDGTEQSLDLDRQLAHTQEDRLEWNGVLLGVPGEHRSGPVRIIVFRLGPENAGRQRAALREAMRTKGRMPKARALRLAGWLLLVTNAPADKLPSSMAAYLYRIRWQVELIFRQAKWVLRLDQTQSQNIYRVQCEIWARLLCAILLFQWHAHANAQCWRVHKSEISFEKLIRIMQQWGHTLVQAFYKGSESLKQTLLELWRRILTGARKARQKSRTNSWDYLELWLNPKQEQAQT